MKQNQQQNKRQTGDTTYTAVASNTEQQPRTEKKPVVLKTMWARNRRDPLQEKESKHPSNSILLPERDSSTKAALANGAGGVWRGLKITGPSWTHTTISNDSNRDCLTNRDPSRVCHSPAQLCQPLRPLPVLYHLPDNALFCLSSHLASPCRAALKCLNSLPWEAFSQSDWDGPTGKPSWTRPSPEAALLSAPPSLPP